MRRLTVLALLLLLLLTTAGCALDEARPAGITERWLQAVSEQGRNGLHDDAVERAERYATPEATAKIKPPDAEEDKRTFSGLEVGRAAVDLDQARVPFKVTARIRDGSKREAEATAVLARTEGRWRVLDVVPRIEGERVPSEGGARPARAKASHWLLALGLALALTAGSIVLIERQSTGTTRANSS